MVMRLQDHLGFIRSMSQMHNSIFIPKYYNPEIPDSLKRLQYTHHLYTLGDFKKSGHIAADTGHEIGKMAYGTGDIPFIRTSDIVNWEIKADPKQGVSPAIYEGYKKAQDIRTGDIFFVRDGTYLVGQACLVTEHDLPCLYQSHILKLRISTESPVSPHLLLACLNAPIVKKQIRAKQFTADVIDTIGNRFFELVISIPKDRAVCEQIASEVEQNVNQRVELRERIRKIPLWVEGHIPSLESHVPTDWSWRDELIGNSGFTCSMSQVRQGIFIPKYYDPQTWR